MPVQYLRLAPSFFINLSQAALHQAVIFKDPVQPWSWCRMVSIEGTKNGVHIHCDNSFVVTLSAPPPKQQILASSVITKAK